MNAIRRTLLDLGIALPERPLDLSICLERTGVTSSYVIAMTGRSGSTWLASALKSIPGAGDPLEYFSEEALPHFGGAQGPRSLADFVADIMASCKTGTTFGFKSDARRLAHLDGLIDLAKTFDPARTAWIDMRRLNIVKQAFSFARAKASGHWHSFETRAMAAPRAVVTDADVWLNLGFVLEQERWLDAFYAKHALVPLKIHYEEISDSKPQLLARVLHAIDPKRDWPDLAGVDGKTRKLASAEDADEENRFLHRHIGLISEILANRGQMTPADLEDRVKTRAA